VLAPVVYDEASEPTEFSAGMLPTPDDTGRNEEIRPMVIFSALMRCM